MTYCQPYLHSKETIGCSHTKLSHLNGCVAVVYDLLSAKECWEENKAIKISLNCIFYDTDLFIVLALLFGIEMIADRF